VEKINAVERALSSILSHIDSSSKVVLAIRRIWESAMRAAYDPAASYSEDTMAYTMSIGDLTGLQLTVLPMTAGNRMLRLGLGNTLSSNQETKGIYE
jgi:hypothetical protein